MCVCAFYARARVRVYVRVGRRRVVLMLATLTTKDIALRARVCVSERARTLARAGGSHGVCVCERESAQEGTMG